MPTKQWTQQPIDGSSERPDPQHDAAPARPEDGESADASTLSGLLAARNQLHRRARTLGLAGAVLFPTLVVTAIQLNRSHEPGGDGFGLLSAAMLGAIGSFFLLTTAVALWWQVRELQRIFASPATLRWRRGEISLWSKATSRRTYYTADIDGKRYDVDPAFLGAYQLAGDVRAFAGKPVRWLSTDRDRLLVVSDDGSQFLRLRPLTPQQIAYRRRKARPVTPKD